ncbi:MAG: PadR family transcriptional regulator [Candidatus Heimdallarchaeota archaeon]
MNFIFPPTKILDSLILMCIIRRGSLHGYALTALIEEKMGWKPSQTAVYNSLKSMEQENLVTSEEKIEKGRVQKIYSITSKGQQVFGETHAKMKENMMKNFSHFISFAQMVSEIEDSDESEVLQIFQTARENMTSILQLITSLFRDAPQEIQVVLDDTLVSLRKIAKKYNIQTEKEEKIEN